MKKSCFFGAIISIALLFTGCGSDITTTVIRPAELNLNGAESICVLPFQSSQYSDSDLVKILDFFVFGRVDDSEPARNIADYITVNLTNSLLNSGFMNVVGSKRVEMAINNGNSIPCDVYLTGYLSNFDNYIKETWSDVDERYSFYRSVKFTVTYEIIDAKTNYVIGRKYYNVSRESGSYRHRRDVPSAISIVESELDTMINKIMHQLEPYEETKYLNLLDDKSKSEDMKAAKKLAQQGFLEIAYKQYYTIYTTRGLFEAGYNSGIILEALGDYEGAEAIMNQLYMQTRNNKVLNALSDIRKERALNNTLQNQLYSRRSVR